MKSTALITGASRGLGAEFARLFASKNTNLVLVARSKNELNDLKDELVKMFKIKVLTIAKDLAKSENVEAVYKEIKATGIEVDYLVNNAGFGDFGNFSDTEWERHEQMINLNISALSHFCYLFAQDWIQRKSGKILNVASTAAFQPGPGMSVYFASKAYVVSFSQAIDYEFRKHGITVTALCPGPVKTNFGTAARMKHPNGFLKDMKTPLPREVVEFGYNAMMKGKPIVIHGMLNKFVANTVGFIPRKWRVKLSAKVVSW
ncbi:MAG: SDR family oxidoreductase [Bacteroidia bacterium]|nr:SDR family oxidoreductase [Bacteroidia bacterium]